MSSLFLPWIVVSGIVTMEMTGTDLAVEPVIVLATLAVTASWLYESGKYRVDGWIVGGLVVEGAILWTLVELNRGIEAQQGMAAGQLFGDMISIDAGLGLFVAAAVAAVIVFVGVREYLTSPEGFALPDAVGEILDTTRQS